MVFVDQQSHYPHILHSPNAVYGAKLLSKGNKDITISCALLPKEGIQGRRQQNIS